MTIIDSNGFINRYRLSKKLSELNTQKEFYVKEINKVTLDKEKFESDEELLEKFAREEYLMKKESEDIFGCWEMDWGYLMTEFDQKQ